MTHFASSLLSLWLFSSVAMALALIVRRVLADRSFGIHDTVLKLGLIGGPVVWLWTLAQNFLRADGIAPASTELGVSAVAPAWSAASTPWHLVLSAEVTMTLLAVWGIAALIQCFSLLRARVALSYLLAEDRLPSHSLWLSTQQLARRMRMGGIEVLCSARIDMPCAAGVFRPRVIVPAWIERLSPSSRRAILAHELAHHARRDPLWLLIAALLAVLLPGHPLLIMTRRRLDSTAELLSDERAARVLENPKDLARGLGEVAGRLRALPAAAAVPALAARRGQLGDRVERILAGSPPSRILPLWSGVPLILALTLLPSIAVDGPTPERVVLAPSPPQLVSVSVPAPVPPLAPAPRAVEVEEIRAEVLARRARELGVRSSERQLAKEEALRSAEYELQRQFEQMEQQRELQQLHLERLETRLAELQQRQAEAM